MRSAGVLFCLLLFALSGCSFDSGPQKPLPRTAPLTRFYLLEGGAISTGELQGKTIVLAFWATTCNQVGSRMSEFNELARKYRNDSSMVFIAASIDKQENLDKVKERIADRDWTSVRHAFSGNDVYDEAWLSFGGERVPYFLAISPSGQIKAEGYYLGTIEEYLAAGRSRVR